MLCILYIRLNVIDDKRLTYSPHLRLHFLPVRRLLFTLERQKGSRGDDVASKKKLGEIKHLCDACASSCSRLKRNRRQDTREKICINVDT
jgi:hypothetical protein